MTIAFRPGLLGPAFRQVLPVMLGYIPVGFAYGVLAQKSGISDLNAILMSLLVYAGSAQLIAPGPEARLWAWARVLLSRT